MKKIFISLLLTIFVVNVGSQETFAQHKVPIPDNIVRYINSHFGGDSRIVYEEIDQFDYSYILQLANGYETDFYKDGLWKLIDCGTDAVPQSIIDEFPQIQKDYLKKNYPKGKIVRLDRDFKRGITATFDDKTEVKFDKNGKFISEKKK